MGKRLRKQELLTEIHHERTALDEALAPRGATMMTVMTRDRKAVLLRDDGTWTYAKASGSTLERLKTLTGAAARS